MPDYLGDKMWDFKFKGHVIQVKIIDFVWLQEFQQGNIDLKPGDSLKAEVNITVDYSFEKEVLNKHYTLTRVINIIHQVKDQQQKLL